MKRTKYYRPANRDYMISKTNRISEIAMMVMVMALLFSACKAKACDEIYLKVGAGYKVHSEILINHGGNQYHLEDESHPVSFRGEIACQSGRFTYGVAKYSQWAQGWPVDKQDETNRVELFIDVKFTLWGS